MNSFDIRKNTREFFRENRRQFIIVYILLVFVSGFLSGLERAMLMNHFQIEFTLENFLQYNELVDTLTNHYSLYVMVVSLLFSLLSGVFSALISIGTIKGLDQGRFRVSDCFDFSLIDWNKLFIIILVSNLVISFLSLFIIPAIVASYSLRMGIYNYYDYPEASGIDALKKSHSQMRGNRFRLFQIELYYYVPLFVGYFLMILLAAVSVLLGVIAIIAYVILMAYVTLLMEIMVATFYKENLRGSEAII